MVETLQHAGRRVFSLFENAFDAAFGPRLNPLFHLGALSFLFFWVVLASGVYLYIFFETSIDGAYRSVESLTHTQWYAGGIARSLHRYASDAMVIAVLLHLLREFTLDRYRGVRWYAWVTGVLLLWLLYASGIGGYWLAWDRLAQYIAVVTTEWLDWLPLFGESIARNFLNSTTVNDRFFSLLSFIHVSVPLFLLLGSWIHIVRISRARTNPPRPLAIGALLALVALAALRPALSQGPANLDTVVSTVSLDWFYLAAYPLIDIWSRGAVWALLAGGTLLLLLLPWLPRRREQPAATVHLANCNGCGRCFADCPYSAVILRPRSDGLPFETEAVVDASLCTACGICVGACPTATPFRRLAELIPGIDMPQLTVRAVRERTLAAAAPLTGTDRVIVYGCHGGPDLSILNGAGVAAVTLPCVAALPPSFIDFAISRHHADGVLLAGCKAGDCYQRLGIEWTEQRLQGRRDPYLRARVPAARVATCWAGPRGAAQVLRELAAFRARLRSLGPYRRDGETPPRSPVPNPEVGDVAYRVG
ncbi:MAG TPA: cytochrome b N-terminal domain-containing protein [Candidatus Methylomirabilis sp.]|nr:cytochrome b N-terminal domain-containing protein [Candidatus Methylomirabilis sp.]